jgi:hypothetical protein
MASYTKSCMKFIVLSIAVIMAIGISRYAVQTKPVAVSKATNPIKNNTVDTPITILTYGMPHWVHDKALHAIGDKYGIQYIAAAGCVVDEALLDSIGIHNKEAAALLAKKYGANFDTQFNQEVKALETKIPAIEALALKYPVIAIKQKEIAKKYQTAIMCKIRTTSQHEVYKIMPSYYEKKGDNFELKTLEPILVNINTKQIIPL